MHFFTFSHVPEFFLLITFLCQFLWNFFNSVFWYLYWIFKKKQKFAFISTLKPNADKTAHKKTKNVFYTFVLELNLATINGLGGSILSKKSKSLYPSVHAPFTLTRVGWFFHHGMYARKWPLQSSVYNVIGIPTPPPTYFTLRLLCRIYTSVPHKKTKWHG